jgi:HEAT repeat protein
LNRVQRVGNETAMPALLARLDDPDEDVRRAAAGALAGGSDPRVIDALLAHLDHDPDELVREVAVRALAGSSDPRDANLRCARILARWPTANLETRELLYDILAKIAPRAYHAVPAEARAEWRARVAEITRSFCQTG